MRRQPPASAPPIACNPNQLPDQCQLLPIPWERTGTHKFSICTSQELGSSANSVTVWAEPNPHQSCKTPDKVAPLNYDARGLDGGLRGDGLGVQCMDVLASWQHTRVADGVASWAWLHIATLYTGHQIIDASKDQERGLCYGAPQSRWIAAASFSKWTSYSIVASKHAEPIK